MDERNIFLEEDFESQEVENTNLIVSKTETFIDASEVSETIYFNDTEEIVNVSHSDNNIEIESAFPPLGDQKDIILHSKLPDINNKDQHPMWAITGLEDKFAEIESIKPIHSNKENIAQYYRWADGNPNVEDRSGCFVTFVKNTNYIEISDSDVIGITVREYETGFIGNDIQYGRGTSYGLVCISGIVPVRALSDVQPGDKVVPDINGRAKKSTNNYGYRVIEIREALTERYAIVALIPETVSLVGFQEDVAKLDTKLDSVQRNTVVAINAANEALNSMAEKVIQVGQQASSAIDIANGAQNSASDAQNLASSANINAALAKEMAQSAQTTVKNIKENVNENLTSAKDKIDELTKEFEPIATWESDKGKGSTWFVDHIENDLATKIYVNDVKTEVDEAKTAIEVNARGVQSLALVERKYFTGTYSPSHGMSLSEAQETLKVGMVYVPTVDTTETAQGSIELFKFYRGNSYIWNGTGWDESTDDVELSGSYVAYDHTTKYWYVDGNDVIEDDITYPANTLCKWVDNQWVVVASSKDVSAPWVASRVYQTANSLESYIGTANQEFTTIKQNIEDVTASIALMATSGDTAALIEAIANGEEVKIDNIAIYNGASLISRTTMSESPIGSEFYLTEPEWNEQTSSWRFSDTSSEEPAYPCWAKFYNDDGSLDGTKYYKYSKLDKNNWVMFIYKYANRLSGISQKVDSNSSNIALVVGLGATDIEGTSATGQKLVTPYYTQVPSWSPEERKWIPVGSPATSTDSPPYYKLTLNNTACFKYTNPVIAEDESITWTSTLMMINNTINAASIVASINDSGSEINMSADRIKLNGGTINMSTNQFTIEAGNGFKVTPNGAITATAGAIGGWKIGTNSLYTGENDKNNVPTIYIGNGNISKAVKIADSVSKADWRLKVGDNFGVDSSGTLYAKGTRISGNIDASSFSMNGVDLDDIFYPSKNDDDEYDGGLVIGDMIIESNGSAYLYAPTIIGGELKAADNDSMLIVFGDGIKYQHYNSSAKKWQTNWEIITQDDKSVFISDLCPISLSSIQSIIIQGDDSIDLRTSNLMINGKSFDTVATFG